MTRFALFGLALTAVIVLPAPHCALAVTFDSLTIPPVELTALLYRPDGPGPFPAVVLLHGEDLHLHGTLHGARV